jgi:hypothetical protein
MSAAVAAPNGAAISNAETAMTPSEVRFMVSPSEGSSLFACVIFAPFPVARQIEVGSYVAFPRLVASGAQCAAQYRGLTTP